MVEDIRRKNWSYIKNSIFDFVVVGGGINGASIYNRLCRSGYKVLLIDKGDFACGTSQSSGMMIWGGLLYLRNFHIGSVYHLSKARDEMIKKMKSLVSPCYFRYFPTGGKINKNFIYSGLYLYWLLGHCNRKRP